VRSGEAGPCGRDGEVWWQGSYDVVRQWGRAAVVP